MGRFFLTIWIVFASVGAYARTPDLCVSLFAPTNFLKYHPDYIVTSTVGRMDERLTKSIFPGSNISWNLMFAIKNRDFWKQIQNKYQARPLVKINPDQLYDIFLVHSFTEANYSERSGRSFKTIDIIAKVTKIRGYLRRAIDNEYGIREGYIVESPGSPGLILNLESPEEAIRPLPFLSRYEYTGSKVFVKEITSP